MGKSGFVNNCRIGDYFVPSFFIEVNDLTFWSDEHEKDVEQPQQLDSMQPLSCFFERADRHCLK